MLILQSAEISLVFFNLDDIKPSIALTTGPHWAPFSGQPGSQNNGIITGSSLGSPAYNKDSEANNEPT